MLLVLERPEPWALGLETWALSSGPKPWDLDHEARLEDPRIAHWFSDNWVGSAKHPKLTQMPIGINALNAGP